MSDEPGTTLDDLRSRARGLSFYVILMSPTEAWASAEADRAAVLRDHFLWQRDLEREGRLLLAGPLDADRAPGHGMSVIRAESREEAVALADSEPFQVAGLRHNEVRQWTVNEGCVQLTVRLFEDRAELS